MTIGTISPAELYRLRESGKQIDLIDVRTPAEFAQVHAEGAVSVPLNRLTHEAVQAARHNTNGEPVYVICHSGGRSASACQQLSQAGMTNVVNVQGGTTAWERAGLPVVREGGGGGSRPWWRSVGFALVAIFLILGWLVNPWFALGAAAAWLGMIVAGGGCCPLDACATRTNARDGGTGCCQTK